MRGRSLCVTAPYQEDVRAQFEDTVDAGKLLKHDGVADPAEELSHKLPDHQDHRCVQAHDAAEEERQEERQEGGGETGRETGRDQLTAHEQLHVTMQPQ